MGELANMAFVRHCRDARQMADMDWSDTAEVCDKWRTSPESDITEKPDK